MVMGVEGEGRAIGELMGKGTREGRERRNKWNNRERDTHRCYCRKYGGIISKGIMDHVEGGFRRGGDETAVAWW